MTPQHYMAETIGKQSWFGIRKNVLIIRAIQRYGKPSHKVLSSLLLEMCKPRLDNHHLRGFQAIQAPNGDLEEI